MIELSQQLRQLLEAKKGGKTSIWYYYAYFKGLFN